ncbi:MAG: hypothetical protein HY319_08505 [Armatimonadetes bacterium]|nr:hypothetical protein [Armatimonadota bacterium]
MSAYTPGLKVAEAVSLLLERRLPLEGEVVVEAGRRVTWSDVVARTELPGRVDMLNVANKLGLEPGEVPESLLVPVGGKLERGQALARNRGFFGLFKSTLPSPMSGSLESVSEITGQVVLRAPPRPVEVLAYVDGVVEEVTPGLGVSVRTFGTFIQGIFGIGGETSGELEFVVDSPDQPMAPECLSESHRGKIAIGGSLVTRETLDAAIRYGVQGIIVAGMHDQDLRDFLGYDLGVAITGSERKGLTLILTEGFGPIRMARRTFELLGKNRGRRASISGATQIRAGVIRPEVIVPHFEGEALERKTQIEKASALEVGATVRVIRDPNFGALGTVKELPVQPVAIPTEARVRVAVIELETGATVTLPRANLELISG